MSALFVVARAGAEPQRPPVADPHSEFLVEGHVLGPTGKAIAGVIVERVEGPHSSRPYAPHTFRTTTDDGGAFRFAHSGLGTGSGEIWYLAVHRNSCVDVIVTVTLVRERMPDGWDGEVARSVVIRLPACAVTPPSPEGLAWRSDVEAGLKAAAHSRRPALLFFAADWAMAAKEMEVKTFTDSTVKTACERFLLIKVDVTNQTDDTQRVVERFHVVALPAIVLVDSRGKVLAEPNVIGYIEPQRLVEALNRVQ